MSIATTNRLILFRAGLGHRCADTGSSAALLLAVTGVVAILVVRALAGAIVGFGDARELACAIILVGVSVTAANREVHGEDAAFGLCDALAGAPDRSAGTLRIFAEGSLGAFEVGQSATGIAADAFV